MSCVRKGRGHQPTGETEQVVANRAGGSGFTRRIPTGLGCWGAGKNHRGEGRWEAAGRGGHMRGAGSDPQHATCSSCDSSALEPQFSCPYLGPATPSTPEKTREDEVMSMNVPCPLQMARLANPASWGRLSPQRCFITERGNPKQHHPLPTPPPYTPMLAVQRRADWEKINN